MANLGLSGLATGLDTRALITQLMAIERRPITLMEKTQAQFRSRIDIYRQINTKLVALQRAAEKVMGIKFNGAVAAKATATDPTKLTATADASAVSGTYNVDVLSLALKQITGGGTFTSPTSAFSMSNAGLGNVTLASNALSGSFNLAVANLARAQMTGGGTYNTPSLTSTNSNPGVVSATVDSTAVSGTYQINVLNMGQTQQTGLGAFTSPTKTATVAAPNNYTATVDNTAAAGTYNVTVNSLAQAQISGGGAYTAPALSGSGANLTGVTVTNAAAFGTTNYAISNITRAHGQITTGGAVVGSIKNPEAGTLVIGGKSVAIAKNDTAAMVADKITNAGAGVTATIDGAGKLVIKSDSLTGTFTYSSTNASLLSALGLNAGAATTQGPANATVTIGGAIKTASSFDTFTAADLGIAGVGFTLGAGAIDGSSTTLSVTNTTGSIRITNTATPGSPTDVAITAGMSASQVASAINAAGTGMNATVDGSGRLRLTGATNGATFTIGDTGGGSALATQLGLMPTIQSASLASVTIGGTTTTSTTNAFTNVMPGVNLNVTATGTAALTIQDGSGMLRITNNATGVSTNVMVNLNATVSDVVNAINAANTGMTAADVGGKLQLTGLQNGVSFTIDDAAGGNTLAASLGIDSATNTTRVAANASIKVDNLSDGTSATYTSTGTTFATAIPGVTLNAQAVGSSTLTIANGAGTLRITNNATGTSSDVAINLNMSASDVANAINAANTGMSAAVDGTGRLVLTGNTTGTSFTVADASGGNAIASSLGIDSATKTTQTALNATMTVNGGPAISSSNNTFVDPITGVTFTALTTGTSTLDITNNSGAIRITNDGDGSFVDVAISNDTTVTAVANAINTANAGMTATVQSGKLVLTGNTAGSSFTIQDSGGGNALATMLGIDSATKTTQYASLAQIAIDGGPAITSTTNQFTNPITGVAINALATGPTTLTVEAGTVVTAQDDAEKKATLDAIRELVTKFNETIGFMKDQSTYDPATKKAGALLGDPLARDLRSGLTRMFNEVVDDTSQFRTAHSAGIQLQRDGTLKIDEEKLKQALETDPAQLKALFTNEDGLMTPDGVRLNSLGATGSTVAGDGVANRLIAFIDSMVSNASAYNGFDANGIRYRGGLLRRISTTEANIDDMDKRIEAYKLRLEQREGTLLAKFNAMEKVVAMLRNQGGYMANQYMAMSGQ